MTTGALLAAAWEPEPSIVVGCALLALLHLALVRFSEPRRTAWWMAGVVVLLLDLVGPLDVLGDDYLFSAHMLEHLTLLLLVPPLLLLGVPERLARRALAVRWVAATERLLRRPAVAWALMVGTLWAWHLPAAYNATLANETIHAVEHLSFLVTATIFWWPVLTPLPERRLHPITAIFYLYAAMVANAVLGILLTFAPVGIYPAYLRPADELGALALIRDHWNLGPAADQQLGGLFMWVIGMFGFLWATLAMLVRWYREPEHDAEPAHA